MPNTTFFSTITIDTVTLFQAFIACIIIYACVLTGGLVGGGLLLATVVIVITVISAVCFKMRLTKQATGIYVHA